MDYLTWMQVDNEDKNAKTGLMTGVMLQSPCKLRIVEDVPRMSEVREGCDCQVMPK